MISFTALALLFVSGVNPWVKLPSVEVKDYGIYSAKIEDNGDWSSGVSLLSDVKLLDSTTKVTCEPGVYWGFQAVVTNRFTDHTLNVTYKVTHPPFTTPDGQVHTEDVSELDQVGPGQTTTEQSLWFYVEECPYEWVPGRWTITVAIDGQDFVSKDFNVKAPGGKE